MKIPSLVGVACIVAAPLALADNHASGNPEWSMGNPVEIYGCSFKAVSYTHLTLPTKA